MDDTTLFMSQDGGRVTTSDFLRAFELLGAAGTACLFIHSELSFGVPNPALPRTALLGALLDALQSVGVPTLCVPTYTFSFCNGEPFDVLKSRSHMGAFNEHVRKSSGAVRSHDPLMSCSVLGADAGLVSELGNRSIGAGSTFDRLHEKAGVRFLFLGADPALCFTYVHHVEALRGVPYRYWREFTGSLTDRSGTSREVTQSLYVRYNGVNASRRGEFVERLVKRGLLRRCPCGDSRIAVVDESAAFEEVWRVLDDNIDFLLDEPYPRSGLDDRFEAHQMRAL